MVEIRGFVGSDLDASVIAKRASLLAKCSVYAKQTVLSHHRA